MTRRVCAYCGQSPNLTNEHVFPECFSKTFQPITTTVTPTGEKAIQSDLEIRDVCNICNNEKLSPLDTYLCELNHLYFSKIVHAGDCVKFAHDLDKTLRTFLKIGYNVARARKWPATIWDGTSQYILGQSTRPVGFRLFLQSVIPTPVGETRLAYGPEVTEVGPFPMRVYSMDMSCFKGLVAAYSLWVWSYRFFILREEIDAPVSVRRRSVSKWVKNNRGATELGSRKIQQI